MRLWSVHPKYLDSKGLTALWREALLAKSVLEGKTKGGYVAHPQLDRFRRQENPIGSINSYLKYVLQEANERGFRFDEGKIGKTFASEGIRVTEGQLRYEFEHLKIKLKQRDRIKYEEIENIKIPQAHPLFIIVDGPVEQWERR